MKCPYCGEDNAADAGFCVRCGSRLTAATAVNVVVARPAPRASRRAGAIELPRIPRKLLITALLCVAAAAVAAGVATLILSRPAEYLYQRHLITFAWDGSQTAVFFDTKRVGEADAQIDGTAQSSLDGGEAVGMAGDGGLYYADRHGVYKIADDVMQYDMFKLAGCGGAVVYRDIHSALTLYSIKDRRAVKITGYTSDMYFQISPDGGTVIYSSGGALYVYTDGRSTPVGEDMTAVAVSDGGKCIYSYNSHIYDPQAGWSETLYVSSAGGELKKLGSGVDTDVIVFNADNTQALYASYHIGYISVNAGEGIEVGAGGWATPCLPEGAVGCASLLNKVYGEGSYSNGEGHVYYVDDKFKTTTLVSNCSIWKIDASAKTLCYVDNSSNNLYRCSVQNPPAAVEIGQDVGDVGFCVSPDGERVYYVNSSGELWRKSGNSAAVKLLDGVYNYISMSTDGTLLCVTSSGTGEFYTCKDGGNMVKAAEITGDYNFAFSMGGFMYYLTESDPDSMYGKPDYDDYPCDLYGSADGVRFSLMCGGMRGYAPAMNNFNL